MDLRHLRNFLGILDAGSLGKAAGALGIAQPALGLQIRALERELNVALLIRHTRGVSPTEAGLLLARHAESLLHRFDQARQDLLDYGAAPRGRIALGLTSTVAQLLIAALVARCHAEFPGVRLAIAEDRSKRLTQSVADDRLDMALTYDPGQEGGLHITPLAEERLMLVRGASPRRLPRRIAFDALVQEALILPARPHLVREMVEAAAQRNGLALRLYCDVDSVPMMKTLVRQGLAPTVLPMGAIREDIERGELRAQAIDGADLKRTLYLVVSGRRPPSKALDAIRGAIESLASELIRDRSVGWTGPAAGSAPPRRP